MTKPEQDWVQCVTCDLVWDDLNPDREECECPPDFGMLRPLPGPPGGSSSGEEQA